MKAVRTRKIEIEVPDSSEHFFGRALKLALAVAINIGGRDFIQKLGQFIIAYIGDMNRLRRSLSGMAPATIDEAVAILGSMSVVTAQAAARKWGFKHIMEPRFVGYTARELADAADANQKMGRRWRLVYLNGISLADLAENRMVIRKESLAEWFLQLPGLVVANKRHQPGYYLIDFAVCLVKKNFAEQEAEISEMGARFERVHDSVLLEAAITLMVVTGEQPFGTADHWGYLKWGGMNIVFGPSTTKGIEIGFLLSSARGGRYQRPLGARIVCLPRHLLRAKLDTQ